MSATSRPLTDAERQRRRRAKVAAARPQPPDEPAFAFPIETRLTRQETWDAGCQTLQRLIEGYRIFRANQAAPAAALRAADLPALTALVQTLAVTSFPHHYGQEWDLPGVAEVENTNPDLDARSLRQQFFSGASTPDPDPRPRTPEEDARGLEWWHRIPPDARPIWMEMADSADPLDIWYILHKQLTGFVA